MSSIEIDFVQHWQAARVDADLHAASLTNFSSIKFLDPRLARIPDPDLVFDVASTVIGRYQPRYTVKKPLRFLIVESDIRNAMCIWTLRADWMVVSTTLLDLLNETAEMLVRHVLHGLTRTMDLPLAQSVRFDPGAPVAYTRMFYATGIAFFLGHEATHAYDGHDGFPGYGADPALRDVSALSRDAILEFHALELSCDAEGATLAAVIATQRFLTTLPFEADDSTPTGRVHPELVLLVSIGAFSMLARVRPCAHDHLVVESELHPEPRFRALWMFSSLRTFFSTSFPELDAEVTIGAISDALAIVLTLDELQRNGKLRESFGVALKRDGDLAALRVTGIRRLLFSDEVKSYQAEAYKAFKPVRQSLMPYARGKHALRIQEDEP